MNITLVTIGYNLPGMTRQVIDSALDGCRHDVTFLVISHTQLPEKRRELEELAGRSDVVYRDYGVNRGLARSWNEGILASYYEFQHDLVVIVNEDARFGRGDLNRIAETATTHREAFLVMGRAFHHDEQQWGASQYGCFAVNPRALNTLGCFDENFFPIYCEDSDYRRRAELAGLEPVVCEETHIEHGGSWSLKEQRVARQNQLTYNRNRNYYNSKWGGEGGTEQFPVPFNDDRFSLYIDPRVREAPYLGYNRTDQEIVKF